MEQVVILIPAYKPTFRLVDIVQGYLEAANSRVIVVDDGGGTIFEPLFEELRQLPNVSVVANAINLGKGAALKHGINWILTNLRDVSGIVTADADGQHTVPDIQRVRAELASHPQSFVLGYRQFGSDVPFRSRFGNHVSRLVYRVLLGLNLKDTQTGLRGLPVDLAKACLAIRSNRYEFETEQLTLAASMKVPIREISIRTIYEDSNASSHFNPLFDSARIYFVVLRYAFSSLATAVVDFATFVMLLPLVPNLVQVNLASRAFAIIVQFALLKSFVFKSGGGIGKFALFVLYVGLTGLVSGILQTELIEISDIGAVASKILVELAIFIFNFLFLREILFRKAR